MTSASVPFARPPSEQLVDLHVYLVPKEVWNEKYRSAYNDVIHQTISAGFLRVWPELSLYYLRNQIIDQLGYDVLPAEYVFLKSVGRCLTQVKTKQEFELKVKNFIPPQVPLPEIFVLEAQRDALNLAAFTNHERMDLIEEEAIGTTKEEPADNETSNYETHAADQAITTSRQKPSHIPRRVNQADSKIGRQASRPAGGQTVRKMGKEPGDKLEKRSVPRKPGRAAGNQSKRQPGVIDRIGRQQVALGRGGRQVHVARSLAGDKPPQLALGTKTVRDQRGQVKTARDGPETGVTRAQTVSRKETSLGSKHKESKITAKQKLVNVDEDSKTTASTESRNRAGTSKGVSIGQEYTGSREQSNAPNVTLGGVPPLHLQHLESVKGIDSSTPLKSGRPDTYTNNTNEDSGIAEFTPERTELDYGRQRSDSLERKQKDEKQQTPRSLARDPRERHEGVSSSLQSAEQAQLDGIHKQQIQDDARQQSASNAAAEQEAERRKEEERARQRVRQIEEDAAKEYEEKQRQLETERLRETERWEKKKREEEERQRLLKARQQELEKRRQQVVAAQEAETRRLAAAQEEARQQRLRDEEEERQMEEEIRKRQADDLRQSRQMSWDQARRRENEQFTPLSQRAGSSQQKDLYDPYARDSIRREPTGDSLDRKVGNGGSTRQSQRPQNDGALLLEETETVVATNENLGSAAVSEKARPTTESARVRLEAERERLIAELHERQEMRFELERRREELMRQAKTLQSRTIDRRNKARDLWKKRYFEEKKKTSPLEEQVNRLRGQVDQQHRKLLNQLEGRGPNRKGMPREPPSKKNDHKILIFKMQHQIDDLKRRVENSKMKLTSEIKLRNQAEAELRSLRTDVLQRKINVTVSRSQQLNTLKESEDKQGARTTPLRGSGATSFTPRGTLRTGLK